MVVVSSFYFAGDMVSVYEAEQEHSVGCVEPEDLCRTR
jgi:hypothetical protein